jgi:peptidoglycan/LPS O-acetylase OafA/YrhL
VTLHQADSISQSETRQDPRPTAKPGFRPDIEGLRGFTLLMILGFHAAVPGMAGGFVGPDVFFIISGFVITGQLYREVSTTGTMKLLPFYGSRARRLLPTASLVAAVTMIAAFILLPPIQAQTSIGDGIASALYVGNYWLIARGVDYFATHEQPSPFEHYWTLGVEEQFYLLWPVVLIGTALAVRWARRRRTGASAEPSQPSKRPFMVVFALIAVSSFALALVATYLLPAAAYFSLPTRAWDLAIGGMLALTADKWQRLPARVATILGLAGLGLLLYATIIFTPGIPYPGTAALVPMIATVLLIGAGCAVPTEGGGRFLSWAPMRAMGRLSYSWYLWHWPVLVFAPHVVGHELGLAGRLIAVAFSGVLGWLTLRYVENPLRYAAPLRRSPGRSIALGGAATVIAAAVGMALIVSVPNPVGRGEPATRLAVATSPTPDGGGIAAYDAAVQEAFAQVNAAVSASAEMKTVPSNLDPSLAEAGGQNMRLLFDGCMRMPFQGGQPECATGDTASTTTVALVGDSTAAMWYPALQEAATQQRWRLELLAKTACPMMESVPASHPLRRLGQRLDQCEQWRALVLDRLRAERPQLVVVSMWRGYGGGGGFEGQSGAKPYDPAWLNSVTRLVRQLRDTGAQVLVLGPVPAPGFVVPVCLAGHLDDVQACTPSRSTAVNPAGIAAETAATEAGGGQYVDLTELFCSTNRCPVIVGNSVVYSDNHHITIEYSQLFGPVMGALANRALAHG